MSKKYKLIKDLPDMNAGKIFEWSTDSNAYVAQKDIWIGNNQWATYSKGTVEQSKEFWEEIKEPEFQIIAAKTSVKVSLTTENTSTEIYKILRLSDNETFSVGDKVEHLYPDRDGSIIDKIYTIEKIYILGDSGIRFYVGGGLNLGLEKLKKYISKPLFTTEDGVDIFSGDNFYLVGNEFIVKYWNFKTHSYIGNEVYLKDKVKFSTEKAAKDWIYLNKPKYSLQDIFNASTTFGCPILDGYRNVNLYKLNGHEQKKELNK